MKTRGQQAYQHSAGRRRHREVSLPPRPPLLPLGLLPCHLTHQQPPQPHQSHPHQSSSHVDPKGLGRPQHVCMERPRREFGSNSSRRGGLCNSVSNPIQYSIMCYAFLCNHECAVSVTMCSVCAPRGHWLYKYCHFCCKRGKSYDEVVQAENCVCATRSGTCMFCQRMGTDNDGNETYHTSLTYLLN